MRVVGIIPARFGATRFPGKPLAQILGKALVERVYLRARKCRNLDQLVVGTDDERIETYCKSAGIPVVMTSKEHQSGTDRVCEIARNLDADAFVNIQGDEPLIPPSAIDELVNEAVKRNAGAATLVSGLRAQNTLLPDPNVVKVARDKQGNAIYFSRSVIPYPRNHRYAIYFQHIGVYYYLREMLLKFAELPPSPLELAEGLEQLRLLENGFQILTVEVDYKPIAVDTPEDVRKVEEFLKGTGEE